MLKKLAKYRPVLLPVFSIFVTALFFISISDLSIFSVHRLCPFSAGCTFYKTSSLGIIYHSGFIFFIFLMVLSLFLRRIFCSFACPIGLIQEILIQPRKILFSQRDCLYNSKRKIISFVTRGFFILGTLFIPFYTGIFFFQDFCPMILTGNIIYGISFSFSLVMLLSFIVLCHICERFFCKFICPLGLLMGIMGKVGNLFLPTATVKNDCNALSKCAQCIKSCPMNIDLCQHNGVIDDSDCTLCYACQRNCPKEKSFFGKFRRVRKK